MKACPVIEDFAGSVSPEGFDVFIGRKKPAVLIDW